MYHWLFIITCGLVSLKKSAAANPEEGWPDQGSLLDGLHPCVESGTLKRARVMNMTIDYMNLDEKDILVQEIGQGKND